LYVFALLCLIATAGPRQGTAFWKATLDPAPLGKRTSSNFGLVSIDPEFWNSGGGHRCSNRRAVLPSATAFTLGEDGGASSRIMRGCSNMVSQFALLLDVDPEVIVPVCYPDDS
jgi:hypothetical protein